MKKNFSLKLMLLGLLGLGCTTAYAQSHVGDEFDFGNYRYKVTVAPTAANSYEDGVVTMKALADGVDADDDVFKTSIPFPGNFSYTSGSKTYKFKVTEVEAPALQNHVRATSVIIPAEITAIPENAFSGCSMLSSITFATSAENPAQVSTIGTHAFATTKIDKFDFSPCTKLQALPAEVFVEAGQNNTFITEVTLPNTTYFKHFGQAFQNLVELATIKGLDGENINVKEVVAEAFKNCGKLTKISLPGSVEYVDKNAFVSSAIKELSINVKSIKYLGGCVVDPNTWAPTVGAANANLWTAEGEATQVDILEKLTLEGDLGGKICTNAFLKNTKLTALDLSKVNFVSQAQIQASAFEGCTGLTAIELGNISDNVSATLYTIEGNAFKDCKIETVKIGNIITGLAIGGDATNGAFGKTVKNVTIGTIKAGKAAIAAKAFIFADGVVTLNLATDKTKGQYLSSDDATTPIFTAASFVFDAVCGEAGGADHKGHFATINIGEIKSKGGVFAAGTFTVGATNKGVKTLNFTGDIAENGIDQVLFDANGAGSLQALTFAGKIAKNGLKGGVKIFENYTALAGVTFSGELSELAIGDGAFTGTTLKDKKVTYSFASPSVPTDIPFATTAFATATVTRDVELVITNETLKAAIKAGLNLPAEADKNQATDIIHRVWFPETVDPAAIAFRVYTNNNAKNEAWGRYDLGSFTVEKGPDPENPYTANTMIINRYQKVGDVTDPNVKLTLYGIYTDSDPIGKESSTYMVPLQVFNGQYQIPATNENLIIIKAEMLSGTFTKDFEDIKYDNTTALTKNSVWAGLLGAPGYTKAAAVWTNQQMWDKKAGAPNIYVDYKGTATTDVRQDLWIMVDPAKNKGFRIDKNVIEKGGAYINTNWYYALLDGFGKKKASAARIVWLTEGEATAIYGVKEVKNAAQDDAIYTLQGIRVAAPVKGQLYIQNGKKFIAK